MELPRYRISRQRVCRQCSTAKAKCSPGFPGAPCGRCLKRSQVCSLADTVVSSYECPPRHSERRIATQQNADKIQVPQARSEPTNLPECHQKPTAFAESLPTTPSQDALDFRTLDLFCPIDAEGIKNRWLNPYIPTPGQKPKAYDATVTSFIHQSLKSYVGIVVHSRGTPCFIHPQQLDTQADSKPLRTCMNVVRLLDWPAQDNTASDLCQKEMNHIFEHRHEYGTSAGLSAFQAYLTYSLAIYFWTAETANSTLVQSMMQLQDLAGVAAKQGIVCSAERQSTRPKWEAWIVAEAKRRTMYVMYLFDGLLSARDGLPSFLGTELERLHAPGCQSLWSSATRADWQLKYNSFLAQWPDGYLTIDELWPNPPHFDQKAIAQRQDRVDHWLEDVDKFGTMMYAVTKYIHKN